MKSLEKKIKKLRRGKRQKHGPLLDFQIYYWMIPTKSTWLTVELLVNSFVHKVGPCFLFLYIDWRWKCCIAWGNPCSTFLWWINNKNTILIILNNNNIISFIICPDSIPNFIVIFRKWPSTCIAIGLAKSMHVTCCASFLNT